ncbi:hypothetical protein FisN_12Hu074 [Fistulifera solaris]|uniref:Uncharacterized protein n=1 Tax=Fistulifera solaris TaxID=1519565 RepID=A0A1Z5K1U0_FISSO|nr:hypothetical protein FisN_12Hu074 [Fistulifera solaris]|eukprot:GAX20227.1 hypothetical protein FisN_12Hu074 [Fistulifera solaris]
MHKWDTIIQYLFAAMEKHEGLRTFRITPYSKGLDPQFLWLKQLLRRNRSLEVYNTPMWTLEVDREVPEIQALNRVYREQKGIK